MMGIAALNPSYVLGLFAEAGAAPAFIVDPRVTHRYRPCRGTKDWIV